MSGKLAVFWQYLIPQRLVCRFVYRAARCRRRWFARPLMRWFAAHYRLNIAEAERPSVDDYESLNDLFTRALAPAARAIDRADGAFVSPADGLLTRFGAINEGTLVQAKGIDYSLAELLGEPDVAGFDGGGFATIYLAPYDYHRVHVPLAGRLVQTRFIAGKRFSVNTTTAGAVPRLFARNERAVFRIEARGFDYFLVMVGALNVSSISTVTRGELESGTSACWTETNAAAFDTGAELGRFNLGSTVIVVAPPGTVAWQAGLREDSTVRLGERIGRVPTRHDV